MPFVLDSFALMAHLYAEPGGDRVRDLLGACQEGSERAWIPMINVGEAIYTTSRRQGPLAASIALGEIDRLPVSQLKATRERILAAAHIKARHRLSYADAFVAAAGIELAATILTGDPEFRSIENEVDIEWLVA